MIKAIIFDFGGVILNYQEENLYHELAEQKQIPFEVVQKLAVNYLDRGHRGEFDSIANFYRTHPSPDITEEELDKIFEKMFTTAFIDEEMFSYLKNLKQRGYKLALLTNFTADLKRYLDKSPELPALFDVISHSYALKMAKPDKEIFQYTLSKLTVSADEAIFIDDREKFVKAAQACGIRAILFKNPSQFKKELELLLL